MSLIRWAILGGLGYWAYKRYVAGGQSPWMPQREQGSRQGRPADQPEAQPGEPILSGPGQGTAVTATDPGGGVSQHRVGRGVVSR